MPSGKHITRVCFNVSSRTTNPPSTSPTSSHAANQQNQPSATRAANPTIITNPTSPAPSSNVSTPLTTRPQIRKFDHTVNKIFSKSLIASLTSKDAVLKKVRDCILTNNESRLKALNTYNQSYWKNLHIHSGCVCIDDKVAIPKVLRETLIDDILACHTGTCGMIFMDTYF